MTLVKVKVKQRTADIFVPAVELMYRLVTKMHQNLIILKLFKNVAGSQTQPKTPFICQRMILHRAGNPRFLEKKTLVFLGFKGF